MKRATNIANNRSFQATEYKANCRRFVNSGITVFVK